MHPVPVCSGLVCWLAWLVRWCCTSVARTTAGTEKKKHLTVSLFGIHCEFKGRLSDRNNKEARSGSADVNAAAATSASATTTNATKKIQKPQGTLLDSGEKRKGGCWLRPGGGIMGHGPWSPCGRCVSFGPLFDSVSHLGLCKQAKPNETKPNET